MKKRSILILFIFAILSLNSCLGPTTATYKAPEAVTETQATQDHITPSSSSVEKTLPLNPNSVSQGQNEPTIITFAVPSFFKGLYTSLASSFHAINPNITVQIIASDAGNSMWMEGGAYALASAADATFFYSCQVLLQSETYFLDLQPLMDGDLGLDAIDFWPRTLDGCTDINGKMAGLPLELSLTGIEFDQQQFDQAGLPYPAPGWTWDDFFRNLHALSGGRTAFLDTQEFYTSILGARIDQAVTNGKSATDLVNQYITAIRNESLYPFDEKQTIGQRQALLAEKQPAMWSVVFGSSFSYSPDPSVAPPLPAHRGLAPYPTTGDGSDPSTPGGLICAAISKGTNHPRETWKWLAFLTENWLVTAEESDRLQLIPARISTTEQSGFWKAYPDEAEPALRFGLAHAWYGPSNPQVFQAAEQALNLSLQDQSNFQSAFDSAQQAARAQPTPTPDARAVVVAAPQPSQPQAGEEQVKFFNDTVDPAQMKGLIAQFEDRHPQTKVELVTDLSGYNFQNAALTNFTANFDCFTTGNIYISARDPAVAQELTPLDAFLSLDPSLADDFFPGLLDQYSENGVLFALPAARDLPTLTYNADLLTRLNVPAPSNDWNFDEFQAILTRIAGSQADTPSYGYALVDARLLLAGRNLELLSASVAQPFRLDQPEIIDGATWLADLVQNHAAVRNPKNDPNQLSQLISAGQVAFWDTSLNGWFFNGNLPQFTIIEIPYPATALPIGNSSGIGYYISKHAKNPNACWDLVSFLSAQPAASPYWPVRKAVAASPEWQALVGSQKAAIFQAAKDRLPSASRASLQQSAIVRFWTDAMERIYTGLSAKSALAEAQIKVDQYLGCLANAGYPSLDQDIPALVNDQCLKGGSS
ncbi:MAG TPA: extracellular solute-binding protein [Anaerolineaceae bacterium]|nr:extracellular solute-binding protein [Anaerolineaceae bacterium]